MFLTSLVGFDKYLWNGEIFFLKLWKFTPTRVGDILKSKGGYRLFLVDMETTFAKNTR